MATFEDLVKEGLEEENNVNVDKEKRDLKKLKLKLKSEEDLYNKKIKQIEDYDEIQRRENQLKNLKKDKARKDKLKSLKKEIFNVKHGNKIQTGRKVLLGTIKGVGRLGKVGRRIRIKHQGKNYDFVKKRR